MFEFIKKTYVNSVRIFLFSILIWLIGFVLYYVIGYFQVPTSDKKTFSYNMECCEIILDTSFRIEDYWNDIIDRKGNINYILRVKIKDNFNYESYSNNKDFFNIDFLDKNGFVLFKSNIPVNSLILSIDSNSKDRINGFSARGVLLDTNKYDKERFDFTKYNQLKNIVISYNLQGLKPKILETPKGWEEAKPNSEINEKDIIWDKSN